ncbi:MAG: tetratricopeptide repeat protein, partial [Ginsengibacter sp.]
MPVNINTCREPVVCIKSFLRYPLLIILSIFISSQSGFAQRIEIDSLKRILPSLKDTARIDCMNELSYQYIRLLKRDSAEYFQARSLEESKRQNYIHGIAESISNQSGIYDFFDNDFIKAETLARESIAWYEKTSNKKGIENVDENLSFALFSQSKYDEVSMIALNKYAVGKKNNDQLKMCDALQGLAVIQFQKGNYDSAFYFSQQAQQIAITNKNSERISSILYGFGTLYREIGDYQTAINNYRTVFQNDTHETIQSRIDGSYETWARMEFAELFSLTGQFDSAWHYYHLFDTTKITDKDLRVYLVSTGETYLLQKNYTKALQNFLRGLVMHRKLNDRNEIKRVLLDIAKTYFALGNNRAVLQYVQEGLGIAIQTKSRQFIRDGYEILYLVYDRLHNIDSAYYYFKKYIATKETVVSGQTKGKYAAYKYEEEINSMNNEKLIARQRLKIQQQQLSQAAFQKKILVLGIFGLILIAGVLFRVIILKRNNEKHQREIAENELQLQKIASEKDKAELQQQATKLEKQALRSQMNPHFDVHSLNSINMFI